MRDRLGQLCGIVSLATSLVACQASEPVHRPPLLLVVLDTTRVDAVSAYGHVRGTTPHFDALAVAGVRFANAYATASWTLPSHASLFTGVVPSRHGVSWRRTYAPDDLVMLAERLRDQGYQTLGVSENPFIGRTFNMAQGFDEFVELREAPGRLETELAGLLSRRNAEQPIFVFVNIIDAHGPYVVREEFLPADVTAEQAAAIEQRKSHYMCRTSELADDVATLHSLYLGDVQAADAKLGAVRELMLRAGLSDVITVVTSDHGEHFGEHELFEHVTGVRQALIHVPLVVHAAPGLRPGVVESPVQLTRVTTSLLTWAGAPVPDWFAPALPTVEDATPAPVIAEFYDPRGDHEPDPDFKFLRFSVTASRRRCTPEQRVWGNMTAIIRPPLKLIRYERHEAQLYDLLADPGELYDLAADRPDDVAALEKELSTLVPADGRQ